MSLTAKLNISDKKGGPQVAFFEPAAIPVAKPSRQRRSANNKSTRCVLRKIAREEKQNRAKKSGLVSVT
jgi:hypothetical protein